MRKIILLGARQTEACGYCQISCDKPFNNAKVVQQLIVFCCRHSYTIHCLQENKQNTGLTVESYLLPTSKSRDIKMGGGNKKIQPR